MLKVITDSGELLQSRAQWNELVGPNAFMRWEWMDRWIRHLEPDTEPFVLVLVDAEGKWKGLAPLCRQTSKTMSRRVRFMGSGKACSDYMNLVCDADCEDEFIAEVSRFLCDTALGKTEFQAFNLLELDGVNVDCHRMKKFLEALARDGFQQVTLPLEGSWVAELPDSMDEFKRLMSKSMRRKVKEARKRLDHEETRILSSRDESFEELWKTFVDLHQQRRHMMRQSGCFSCAEFETFLYEAAKELVAAGLAELTIIENSGSPLAASLSLFDGDTWMLYQTGFDASRRKESPGYQIVLQAVRTAIQRNYRQFDLLRGDEPYKSRWNTQRVELAKLRLIPPTTVAITRNNLWTAAKSLKTIARKFVWEEN